MRAGPRFRRDQAVSLVELLQYVWGWGPGEAEARALRRPCCARVAAVIDAGPSAELFRGPGTCDRLGGYSRNIFVDLDHWKAFTVRDPGRLEAWAGEQRSLFAMRGRHYDAQES